MSDRVEEASARAAERLQRQRALLRPLGVAVVVAVALTTKPGGASIAVLCVFAAALLYAISHRFLAAAPAVQVGCIVLLAAAGVALGALQPHAATELAGGAAVWIAVTRLPQRTGLALAAATTIGLAVAEAARGNSVAAVAAAVLLCALLAITATFIKQARESEDRTELLLAQLEDAREEQLRSAAIAERSRIAAELHDVLAHALSGAAIQLQGARKLAEREHASAQVRDAIDRAGELVRDGLVNAREAVGALRGDRLPDVGQLETLVASFTNDTACAATLRVEGAARRLPPDVGLALYRGAQEALTNVARYAPGATAEVVLQYDGERTRLIVENARAAADGEPLRGVGGGNGLAGLRERVARVGGTMHAGPTETGWRVDVEVPA